MEKKFVESHDLEILTKVAQKLQMDVGVVTRIIEAYQDSVIDLLKSVRIVKTRLAVFIGQKIPARVGKNPETGFVITIPEHNTVEITPSNYLRK